MFPISVIHQLKRIYMALALTVEWSVIFNPVHFVLYVYKVYHIVIHPFQQPCTECQKLPGVHKDLNLFIALCFSYCLCKIINIRNFILSRIVCFFFTIKILSISRQMAQAVMKVFPDFPVMKFKTSKEKMAEERKLMAVEILQASGWFGSE